MFKKLITLILGVLLFSMAGYSQTFDFKTHQFIASDYSQWSAYGTNTIASGAQTVIVEIVGSRITSPGNQVFSPFVVNNQLLVDVGASQETVTITAASCLSGGTSCSFTATFLNAHTGRFLITSGTYGLQEALNQATKSVGGSTVIAQPSWSGTTAMITGLAGGTVTTNIIDMRSGTEIKYYWNGASAYIKTTNAYDATAPESDITTQYGSALKIMATSFMFTAVSGAGITTAQNTILVTIPAGAIAVSLTARVTTAFGATNGLTSFAIKDRSAIPVTVATGVALTSGTTLASKDNGASFIMKFYASQNNLDIVATGGTGFDATGALRVTLYYIQAVAPVAKLFDTQDNLNYLAKNLYDTPFIRPKGYLTSKRQI